jgi:hypothetical protein
MSVSESLLVSSRNARNKHRYDPVCDTKGSRTLHRLSEILANTSSSGSPKQSCTIQNWQTNSAQERGVVPSLLPASGMHVRFEDLSVDLVVDIALIFGIATQISRGSQLEQR